MIKEIKEHRSIRNYESTPISQEVLDQLLESAMRASTTGNMQLYSIVVTQDAEAKQKLGACHFNQPMIAQAPMLVTFCADMNRFSQWCAQRDAAPCYDNFVWFTNATIDTVLASQNFALAAEHEGLGICYLGTTVYTAKSIIELLDLPKGVIPITTLVVGYPASTPPLTDRLPVRGVVHYEKYNHYTAEQIDDIWSEKEQSEETKTLLEQNQLDNLAKIFTQNRYKAADNIAISKSFFDVLVAQDFFNQK